MTIQLARRAAIAFGVALPLVETAIKGAMFLLAVLAVIVVLNWTPTHDLDRQRSS